MWRWWKVIGKGFGVAAESLCVSVLNERLGVATFSVAHCNTFM